MSFDESNKYDVYIINKVPNQSGSPSVSTTFQCINITNTSTNQLQSPTNLNQIQVRCDNINKAHYGNFGFV